jgi:hypothetical protein
MKRRTSEVRKGPGFRFDLIDAGLILLLVGVSIGIYGLLPDGSASLIPLYLGLSFFLFCNVFRIGNRLEAIWYVPFAVIAAGSILCGNLTLFWILVASVLEPLKWVLIAYRIWRGPYRGIFHDRLGRK